MNFKLCLLALLTASTPQVSPQNLASFVNNAIDKTQFRVNPDKPCNSGLGICVPWYNCFNGTINQFGYGLIDIRMNIERECFHYFEKCCAINEVSTTIRPTHSEQPGQPGQPGQQGQSGQPGQPDDNLHPEIVVEPPRQPETVHPSVTTNPTTKRPSTSFNLSTHKPFISGKKCGFKNSNGVGFKITGNTHEEAEFGEFSWMIVVMNQSNEVKSQPNYLCGGSLIHPSVVLTAAHCVNNGDASTLVIRAGEWDFMTDKELYAHSDHRVEEVVMHKDFAEAGLLNAVALLFLSQPVNLFLHVQPICLPPLDATFDHSRCFVSGWGKDKFGSEGKYQAIMKKVEVPIVPSKSCQEKLRGTLLSKYFVLHDSFLCAGGEPEKDMCTGDGGSPLVCPVEGVKGHFQVVGITAWGMGCGEEGLPGAYVNVAKFRKWIDEQIEAHGMTSEYYTI